MGKVHQRRIVDETKEKSAAILSKATNDILPENSG